jgi:enediyne biosynthesis protein E4
MRISLIILTLIFTTFAFQGRAAEMPRFFEETKSAGIDHTYSGKFEYMVGGGLATFDCNGDDSPDLYFAGGEGAAKLYQNQSQKGEKLNFKMVEGSGLNLKKVTGAYPLDIDGDQVTDLAVLRIGENVLMRGRGNCRFERANEAWKFDGGDAWTTAFTATWEKGSDWPTLVFGNFMDPETIVMDYGDCDAHALHRPGSAGGYEKPLPLGPGHCSLSMLFSDWNRDGVPDLRISNDKEFYRGGEEQLFALNPGANPQSFTREEGWNKVNIWGMGIASHDITGDGFPDYYLTNMVENRFEVHSGGGEKPAFIDRANEFGIAAGYPFTGGDKKPSSAWHAEFNDVNNDGLADLLVVKGNVDTVAFLADADPNNLLIQQADGSFLEGAKEGGALSFELGRGGALIDLNDDGALDLIATNRFTPVEVWRNQGVSGNWLRLKLDYSEGNHRGVGSWIEVKTKDRLQRREITVGGGHAGGHWGWLHFGLGSSENAEARAQWPDGKWGPWIKVQANSSAVIKHEH